MILQGSECALNFYCAVWGLGGTEGFQQERCCDQLYTLERYGGHKTGHICSVVVLMIGRPYHYRKAVREVMRLFLMTVEVRRGGNWI